MQFCFLFLSNHVLFFHVISFSKLLLVFLTARRWIYVDVPWLLYMKVCPCWWDYCSFTISDIWTALDYLSVFEQYVLEVIASTYWSFLKIIGYQIIMFWSFKKDSLSVEAINQSWLIRAAMIKSGSEFGLILMCLNISGIP